jgi:hypothetical protein
MNILLLSIKPQIEIHTVKKVNLKGGTLIDGFPSGGLTNSIASVCFMNSVLNKTCLDNRFTEFSADTYGK